MIFAQLLVELKGADPVAVTATETVRSWLGEEFGMAALRRRRLVEIARPGEPGSESGARLAETLEDFARRTFGFWNSNKERLWIRVGDAAGAATEVLRTWEQLPGRPVESAFGASDLSSEASDHWLVWERRPEGPPADLLRAIEADDTGNRTGPPGFMAADVYTLGWRDTPSREERARRMERIGVVSSRREGFLIHPHFQEHRLCQGPLRLPLWEHGSTSMEEDPA